MNALAELLAEMENDIYNPVSWRRIKASERTAEAEWLLANPERLLRIIAAQDFWCADGRVHRGGRDCAACGSCVAREGD